MNQIIFRPSPEHHGSGLTGRMVGSMMDCTMTDPAPQHDDPLPPGQLAKRLLLIVLVVCGFVALWMAFGSMTASPGDVDAWVEQLGRRGNDRWRAAVSLAAALKEGEPTGLKSDRALAARLADVLDAEIDAARFDEDEITLRVYLCRTLGEFHVADGLDALLVAAGTQRDRREVGVRRAAIEALAVLASQLGPEQAGLRARLVPVLEEASRHDEAPLRSAAAFTLGVVGGPQAETRLEAMLQDGHADVRFNAATGLARHGNAAAIDVLREMLDPQQTAGLEAEKQQAARAFKTNLVLINALRAVGQLAAANPQAVGPPLRESVRRLARAEAGDQVSDQVRVLATAVLVELEQAAASRK